MFDFDKPQRYAVMGNPVSHSKSPVIHTQFARQCGIRLEYGAIQVDPGGFAQAVDQFRASGGKGLNITVPFKLEAFRLADRKSARAERARAVNVLKFEADGGLYGDNVDGVGLVRDLTVNLGVTLKGNTVLILGAGGAVRGVLGPLLDERPAALVIANRTVFKAKELAEQFAPYIKNSAMSKIEACGYDQISDRQFGVVINATSASLQGEVPPLPGDIFAENALAYDLMYGNQPTPFMGWARENGAAKVADGLGMLVEQAVESFFLWHGKRPDAKQVMATLRKSL
jgi:shikimate dehydrogenase